MGWKDTITQPGAAPKSWKDTITPAASQPLPAYQAAPQASGLAGFLNGLPNPDEAAANTGFEPDPRSAKSMQEGVQNAPQALGASAGGASVPFSLGAQTAVGALSGAIQPADGIQQRIHNTVVGGLSPLGFSAVTNALAPVARGLGGWLSGMNRIEKQGYVPGTSESMADATPPERASMARQQLQSAQQKIWDNTASDREAMGQMGGGGTRSVQVTPSQFQGTAAQAELQRIHNLADPSMQVPTGQLHTVNTDLQEVTPTQTLGPQGPDTTPQYGPPETNPISPYNIPEGTSQFQQQAGSAIRNANIRTANQANYNPYLSGQPSSAATQEVIPGVRYDSPGFPQEGTKFVDQGTQTVQRPFNPASEDPMTLTWQQGQGVKGRLQDAAQYNYNQNPQVYSAANDTEAQAALRMRKALDGAAPESAALNDRMESAAHASDQIDRLLKTNPSRIYTSSESIGSTPMGEIADNIDKQAGTSFVKDAGALDAGMALRRGSPSTLRDMLFRPAGAKIMRYGIPFGDAASSLSPGIADVANPYLSQLLGGQNASQR